MKHNHKTFIIEMIKHGDKTLAYQKAYPNCTDDESARKSAERLLRHHPDIAEEIEEATAQIRHQAYTDAYRLYTEQQKTKLLSIMDKREILARIAKCEIKVCRYIKDGDRYRMLFEDPHPREIMRAIEADGRIEDRCNRARNLADPKLSQFNVYIDGRPCDDPTAPVNPDLPPGIFMLPRTRKKLTQEQGNKTEQTTKKGSFPVFREGGTNEESDGRVDSRRLPAPEQTLTEEHGNKTEQTTSPQQGVPIAIGIGVPLAPEKSSIEEQGNKMEQSTLSPAGGGVRFADGGGILAPEKNPTEEQGNKREQTTEISLPLRLSDSAVKNLNTLQSSPLYPQYLALYQKRKLQAEDLMCASFYSQNKAAEASAPPPHILTEEEVRKLHADADNKKEQNKKQPQQPYNTFGKMYFPPDRS
jgi:hypothetical protein